MKSVSPTGHQSRQSGAVPWVASQRLGLQMNVQAPFWEILASCSEAEAEGECRVSACQRIKKEKKKEKEKKKG